LHEALRRLFAVGFEDHEPERLVRGLAGSPGQDDLPALGRARKVLEVLADRGAVRVGPGRFGTQPGNEPQDIEVRQKFSRAAPSPTVKVFG
jgi:hypothetical protein